jgi:tetratricopeptide (TPR) repeat protein
MVKSISVVFPCCLVVWVAMGIGVAQRRPISQIAGSQTISEAFKAKAVELNRQGSDSVRARQFDQAQALFTQAIQLDPKLPDAHENLALLFLLEGNDVAAEQAADQLLTLAPANYNGRLVAGVSAINRSKYSQGKKYLSPLIRSGTDDPLVTAAYAVALDRSGKAAEAANFSTRLQAHRVEASDALLAGQIFRQPRLKKIAQKWLEDSLDHAGASVNPEALYMLASMYADQGRTTDAQTLYGRILEGDPRNVDALVELSELERSLGEQEKSDSHLYSAKTLAATDASTLFHFSQVCMRRRMYVDARDALNKVVAQDPLNRQAWYQLGLAQFRIGEPDAAEKAFRSALGLDAQDEWSRIGLGVVLLSTGRQEAAAEFQRVLQRNPQSAAAHYYLGLFHRNSGENVLALSEMKLAVRSAGGDARPLAALGQLQLAQHDLTQARVSLQKAINIDPGYAPAHYQMAMLLNALGEHAEAMKQLEQFNKYHDEEKRKGIVGLVSEGKWDYAGFLPSN